MYSASLQMFVKFAHRRGRAKREGRGSPWLERWWKDERNPFFAWLWAYAWMRVNPLATPHCRYARVHCGCVCMDHRCSNCLSLKQIFWWYDTRLEIQLFQTLMQCIKMPFKDSRYVSMGILTETLERFVYCVCMFLYAVQQIFLSAVIIGMFMLLCSTVVTTVEWSRWSLLVHCHCMWPPITRLS